MTRLCFLGLFAVAAGCQLVFGMDAPTLGTGGASTGGNTAGGGGAGGTGALGGGGAAAECAPSGNGGMGGQLAASLDCPALGARLLSSVRLGGTAREKGAGLLAMPAGDVWVSARYFDATGDEGGSPGFSSWGEGDDFSSPDDGSGTVVAHVCESGSVARAYGLEGWALAAGWSLAGLDDAVMFGGTAYGDLGVDLDGDSAPDFTKAEYGSQYGFAVSLPPSPTRRYVFTGTAPTLTNLGGDNLGTFYAGGTFQADATEGGGVNLLSNSGGSTSEHGVDGTDVYVARVYPNNAVNEESLVSFDLGPLDSLNALAVSRVPQDLTHLSLAVCGTFTGAAPPPLSLDAGGVTRAFVIALKSSLEPLWARMIDEGPTTGCNEVAVDSEDGPSVYVGGFLDVTAPEHDYYVRAFEANGDVRWTQTFSSTVPASLKLNALEVDDTGRVFLAGYFYSTITWVGADEPLTTAQRAIVLFELDPATGAVVCSQTWETANVDARVWSLSPVVLDSDGSRSLFVTASFTTSLDFGLGDLVAQGALDLALLRIDY